MNNCNDHSVLDCTNTNFSNFTVVKFVANGRKNYSQKYVFGLFKAGMMLLSVLFVFAFIPFKFHEV